MKRLEMSLLRLEFLSHFDIVPANKYKKKNRPVAGRGVVQCRDYEFLFGGGASGYCVMSFDEIAALQKWKRERKAKKGSMDDLTRQYIKKLVYLRKDFCRKGGKI